MNQEIKINYYDKFRCIANKCSFNCCQEWRISVDEETLNKWEGVTLAPIKNDEESLPEVKLCSCLESDGDGFIIAYKKDKQCPFLDGKKLCRIVSQKGEDYLADTCTTFPRQINEFEGRKEYSLDACCPVVIDIMYENKETISFIGKEANEEDTLYAVRSLMLEVVLEEDYTLPERMMITFYVLLDLMRQKKLTTTYVASCKTKAYLEELVMAIRNMPFDPIESAIERNELFLDVVENYRKNGFYTEYLEGISELAEVLEDEYSDDEILELNEVFETEFRKYENLMQNYLVSEIFGNSLMPKSSLEDLVVAFEWIAMEYVSVKQAIFLKWLKEGSSQLTYDMVRDYLMIVARVTGYDHEDIREYMENSFEDAIWEWGYMALVLGNGEI
ncbi:flagellin lysine-N-methylase [Cellulosilyticum ruminicola]|uniref:flagellin lysine-N-methylase n=1 Tax=Cellulosilyticum ruminicola TaxID=425254 RepID=UPI0006D06218|nr:flagellin lysine-N-methylase [Cellulosilyticum ruminicola]